MADARETGQVQRPGNTIPPPNEIGGGGYTRLELRQGLQGVVTGLAEKFAGPIVNFGGQSIDNGRSLITRRRVLFAAAGFALNLTGCVPPDTSPTATPRSTTVPFVTPTSSDIPRPSIDTNLPAATSPSQPSQSQAAAEKPRIQALNIEDWPYWAAGMTVGKNTIEELGKFNANFPDKITSEELPKKISELIQYLARRVPDDKLAPLLKQINRAHNLALYNRYGTVAKGTASTALKTAYGSLRGIAFNVAKGLEIFKGPLQIFFMEIPCSGINTLYAYLTTADRNSILQAAGCDPVNPNNISMINDSMILAAQNQGKILIPFEVKQAEGFDGLNNMIAKGGRVIFRRAEKWVNQVYDGIEV